MHQHSFSSICSFSSTVISSSIRGESNFEGRTRTRSRSVLIPEGRRSKRSCSDITSESDGTSIEIRIFFLPKALQICVLRWMNSKEVVRLRRVCHILNKLVEQCIDFLVDKVGLTDVKERIRTLRPHLTWLNNSDAFMVQRYVESHTSGMTRVSCGLNFSLFCDTSGVVFSCGEGADGRLGHGDDADRSLPILINALEHCRIVSVASGDRHSFVIANSGAVYSWGDGSFGKLGNGTIETSFLPQRVLFFSGMVVTQIACGGNHTLFLTNNGKPWSCGSGADGQLGLPTCVFQSTPQCISDNSNCFGRDCVCTKVSAGRRHSCFLNIIGEVFTCGEGSNGRLGHGSSIDLMLPCKISTPEIDNTLIISIGCGGFHTVIVSVEGEVFSFGKNQYNQLGHSALDDVFRPQKIEHLSNVEKVWCGAHHTIIGLANGHLLSCGCGQFGRLGQGPILRQLIRPGLVVGIRSVEESSAGDYHCAAILADNKIYTWGRGREGQLGNRARKDECIPIHINAFYEDTKPTGTTINRNHLHCRDPQKPMLQYIERRRLSSLSENWGAFGCPQLKKVEEVADDSPMDTAAYVFDWFSRFWWGKDETPSKRRNSM
eukprot:GHVL01033641.1.p1 GENE.GHVL01033641.1~~GHVL01033641.1.p1  ORF type:complete len:602 (+),score=54.44 GHVL01033641.1:135-1940(+)